MSETQAEYKVLTLTKEQIQAEIASLAEAEHVRSHVIGNDRFHTAHEGYAVLKEEIEELAEEADEIITRLATLWVGTRLNKRDEALEIADDIHDTALAAAYEAIQVAAMAEKYLQCLGTEE